MAAGHRSCSHRQQSVAITENLHWDCLICFVCLLSITPGGDGRSRVSRSGTVHRTPSVREARRRRLAHWDIRRRSIFSSSLSKQILTRECSGLRRPYSIHHKTCISSFTKYSTVPYCLRRVSAKWTKSHCPDTCNQRIRMMALRYRQRDICPNTAL